MSAGLSAVTVCHNGCVLGPNRWLPEEIKLKLPTKQTNANLSGRAVSCDDSSILGELSELCTQ